MPFKVDELKTIKISVDDNREILVIEDTGMYNVFTLYNSYGSPAFQFGIDKDTLNKDIAQLVTDNFCNDNLSWPLVQKCDVGLLVSKGVDISKSLITDDENNIYKYDDRGNETYFENSRGYWSKREYDDRGNETYFENSDGFWEKYEHDDHGNETYRENSNGFKWGTPKAELEQEPDIERE